MRCSAENYPLHAADFALYRNLYRPNLVEPRRIFPGDGLGIALPFVENVRPGTIRFNFDATNVRTEDEIQIRANDHGAWRDPPLATFPAGVGPPDFWEHWGPKSPQDVYGIFSTTHAYTEGQERRRTTPIGFVRWARIDSPPPPSVSLSALTISGATFTFSPQTRIYTVSVAENNRETTVTATASDSAASVTIEPDDAVNSTTAHEVNLVAGKTTTIRITVRNGPATGIYEVNVFRPPWVSLKALTISNVPFMFDPETLNYTVDVPATLLQTTVTATASDDLAALVTIEPDDADGSVAGHQVNLVAGETTEIKITVRNGGVRTYKVEVNRLASVSLRALAISGAPFPFHPTTARYSVRVPRDQSQTTVTATASDDAASVMISPLDAVIATTAHEVNLAAGQTTHITIVVENGNLTLIYRVDVSRPAACTLTVTSDDPGGTASQSARTVDCDDSIRVSATANRCYTFTGWSGASSSTSSTVTIVMDRSKSVHAGFQHDGTTYTLEVLVAGRGTVTGAGTYDCGDIVTATATAVTGDGWHFETWEPPRFGTQPSTQVRMTRSGWIKAHFVRTVVGSGSFTVIGRGATESAAETDATALAAAQAVRVGADRHWRTALSNVPTTTVVSYESFAAVTWESTGTASGTAGPLSTRAAAEAAAIADANADVPAGATVTGTTTTSEWVNIPGGSGWYASSDVSWLRSGDVIGFGRGSTAAGAEAAALRNAIVSVPSDASVSETSYVTRPIEQTDYTATADYSWETYSNPRADSESGDGDMGLPPPGEPEPY